MTSKWPPNGYSEPDLYRTDDRVALLIGILLLLPIIAFTEPSITTAASELLEWYTEFGKAFGLTDYPLLFLTGIGILLLVWILGSAAIIISVHEAIHYVSNLLFGLTPVFQWTEQMYLRNPTVVAHRDAITRWENILILGGPFVILSGICLVLMVYSSGVLAGTAALMLLMNAAPSCNDLYNVLRLVKMPKSTIFINFNQEDGIRTEYVVPLSED